MEQTSKEILIKDLCARLPYEVKGLHRGEKRKLLVMDSFGSYQIDEYDAWFDLNSVSFKPYLFPLSSMTKEQQEEFDRIYIDDMRVIVDNITNRLEGKSYETNFGPYKYIDWLNENHFDYRGLIPMGLAIDATELNIY